MDIRFKIVIIAIAIPVIIFLWPSFLGGSTDFIAVDGQSMLPTITPGSFVISQKQPSYEIDDIVAFYQREGRASKIIVHRIVEDTERGFRMKGDNNPSVDTGFYKKDQVIGKIVFVVPLFGYVLAIIRNPIVMIISSIVILIIQSELKKRKKGKLGPPKGSMPRATPNVLPSQIRRQKISKPDYTLFILASIVNIIVYIDEQSLLLTEKTLNGTLVSGWLYRIFDDSIASTISFGIFFIISLLLYIFAKSGESRIISAGLPGIHRHLYDKKSRKLRISQAIWVLFILIEAFYFASLAGLLK